MRLNLKPLSVNEAFQGQRFKTRKYDVYIREVLYSLKKMEIPTGQLEVNLVFGLSSKNADIDNPVKCFIDCLQKKYGFNDRQIYKMSVRKVDVDKGKEFIEFDINGLNLTA